jgi:hypothetical protein
MLINNYDIWKVTNSDFSVSFDDAHQTYNILNSTAIQVKVSAINGSRVIYGDFTCLKTASFKFLVIGLQERVSLNNLTINIFESTTDMRRHIFKYITTLLNPKNLTWSEVSNFVLTETDESSRIFSDDVQSWGIAPICQTATASDYIIELIPNTENDYSNVVEVKFVVTAKPTSNYLVGRTVLSSIFVQVERQA